MNTNSLSQNVQDICNYKNSLQEELKNILDYWITNAPDDINSGFYGKINHENKVFAEAPKGSVLNSRILWAFSAAYNYTGNPDYLRIATRAYEYFVLHFMDEKFGGVYWTVDYQGNPLDTKKQTYATSFALYALSEYYKCMANPEILSKALKLYKDITNHTQDKNAGGYFEGFTRDWSVMEDIRLSAKDANEKKSMNTHLHVIEGFANLYTVWSDETLKKDIEELLELFSNHIIQKNNHHLNLFFQEDWKVKGDTISYGHDIEAAWLLQEAAEIIKDKKYIDLFKELAVLMAQASIEGLDKDGGLWYEYEPGESHLIKQKHSWPQAEAMIGFFNAWQITGDEKFLNYSTNAWKFTQQYILDKERGEWVWGVQEDYSVMTEEDKVGIWKCPYHNSRACIELMRRIDRQLK